MKVRIIISDRDAIRRQLTSVRVPLIATAVSEAVAYTSAAHRRHRRTRHSVPPSTMTLISLSRGMMACTQLPCQKLWR